MTIAFNDSRHVAGKQVSYTLTIDGIAWNSGNGCPLGDNTKVTPDVSQNGYAKITRTCNIPATATAGSHTLQATPTIYSEDVRLNSAETLISVRENDKDLVLMVIRFFSQLIKELKAQSR